MVSLLNQSRQLSLETLEIIARVSQDLYLLEEFSTQEAVADARGLAFTSMAGLKVRVG